MKRVTILAIDDSPTILRVVQTVLARGGYEVQVAPDGEEGLRLAHELRPDLVLLDFVMPKMNGYQVCRALADAPATRAIPVVLMSAKGDEVGERFVKVMGSVAYITKPFTPEQLLEVVAEAIAQRTGGPEEVTGDGPPPAAAIPEPADPVEIDPDPNMTNPGAVPNLVDPSETLPVPPPPARAAAVAPVAPAVSAAAPADEALGGDLARVPAADVLQLLGDERHTGILAFAQPGRRVEIFLRRGRVDYAGAEGLGEEHLLGRFLVEREAISKQDLEIFFSSRGTSGGRLCGEQLVKLNYIRPDDLQHALARQAAERVYEVLRWKSGRFSFRAVEELGPRASGAALQLGVDELLLEGLRRVEEWHLLAREIDDLDLVFLRNEEALARLGRDQLGRDDMAILELVNAKNSVRDIVRQSRMGTFEVTQSLSRLRSIRLIRRRVQPVAV